MKKEVERRLLQVAVGLACIVPLAMGGISIVQGAAVLKGVSAPLPVDLDSHFRYLSGLLLGIGLVFLASLPRIETRRAIFRGFGAVILVGGLARAWSLLDAGMPSAGHQFGLVMELIVLPLLVLWQGRLATRFGH